MPARFSTDVIDPVPFDRGCTVPRTRGGRSGAWRRSSRPGPRGNPVRLPVSRRGTTVVVDIQCRAARAFPCDDLPPALEGLPSWTTYPTTAMHLAGTVFRTL